MNLKLAAAMTALSIPAIILIGCGGSGSGSNTTGVITTTGSTGSTDSIATVNLPSTPGLLTVTYLSGQGRAAGDTIANINRADLTGTGGSAQTNLQATLNVNLSASGYTNNSLNITTNTAGMNSAQFNNFEFVVSSLQSENSDGSLGSPVFSATGGPAVDDTFAAQIATFTGRNTQLPIYLDDSMISIGPNSTAVYDRTAFLAANTTATDTNLEGFLSDYVAFDLSNVPGAPTLSDGSTANRIFFSGDRIAISSGTVTTATSTTAGTGKFEVFTPSANVTGVYVDPLPANASKPNQPTFVGTYNLTGLDPRDLNLVKTITSLSGIYRPVTQVMANFTNSFEVLFMPHTDDSNQQDVVAVVQSGGKITNLYYGYADLTAKTIALFPMSDLATGDIAGEVDGTITDEQDNTAAAVTTPPAVRQGHYTFTGTLPTGFKAAGRYVVFRI